MTLPYEDATSGQNALPSGRTVLEHVEHEQVLPALERAQ